MKKLFHTLHLWLGMVSGIIVFILAVTGCIYAFQDEIQHATQSYRYVEAQNKPYLPPSTFQAIAEKELPGKKLHSVEYADARSAAVVTYFDFNPEYYYLLYANPYTGEILKVKNMDEDFFRFILLGHYYLWLPPEIGQPIAATATLVFVFMLISGLVLWWPKNKAAARQRFSVKWSARWRRKNYDLHNVLGFYAIPVALILALTGLIMGFQWFSKSVYWTLSRGKAQVPYYEPLSAQKATPNKPVPVVDLIWEKTRIENPKAETIEIHYPASDSSAIGASTNTDSYTYWKGDHIYYDQNTLANVPVTHAYGRFSDDLSAADKLMRMNYDIHVGAIAGLPGKILAFIISFIVATLPVTGFMIWWGRRKQTKENENKPAKPRGSATARPKPYAVKQA